MRSSSKLALACVAMVVVTAGCRHRHAESLPPDPSMAYGLGSPDAGERKDAAEKLRDHGGPPPEAMPHLVRALQRENDDDAREEELVTIGASGAPEAKPILEQYLNAPDRHSRNGAEHGLEKWSKRNGVSSSTTSAIAKLSSADADKRRDGASSLDSSDGVPPNAVAALVAAASHEPNPRTMRAMLSALGTSGAPEARPIILAHLQDPDEDVRRSAHRAMKKWSEKNGEVVRRDVEARPVPPVITPVGPSSPSTPPSTEAATSDGCQQFKDICDKDAFAVDKCRADLKPFTIAQAQVWADCVNESKLPCQQAHDACVVKVKKGK